VILEAVYAASVKGLVEGDRAADPHLFSLLTPHAQAAADMPAQWD
jgi:hypothetical protein